MTRFPEIRTAVEAEIQRVLEESGRPVVSLRDDDSLFVTLGLDSLDLAQVVVALEQSLKVDPFRKRGISIRTFGDLVQAYRAELENAS
jgi:acyl carrier protein